MNGHATDLLELAIRPTLAALDMGGEAAERQMLGTALAESGGTALRQRGGGPALGLWQMEPATHDDIWDDFLAHRHDMGRRVLEAGLCSDRSTDALAWNLRYACAMARVHYWRVPAAIPDALEDQARYWKRHYNTSAGKGTVEHYLDAWRSAA